MLPNRPYLIRALYDWILDSGLTPHLLVNATADHVIVPRQFIQEGRIVLNISPTAVRGLELGNDLISFEARFSGTSMDLSFPTMAVLGIYARENGRGMLFPEEENTGEATTPVDTEPPSPPKGKPSLKVVK